MFNICARKGFHIALANGWTLSVQFGYGNYCDNRSTGSFDSAAPPCPNAEIAVLHTRELNMIEFHADQVKGWVTPDQVARLLGLMVTWPTDLSDYDASLKLTEFFE